jgi:uncharacterized protein YjbJ (UPF0337 family)
VKGNANEIKGKVKENVGHLVGNSKMEGEGIVDRVKGKIQKGVADVKDAVKKGVDTSLGKKS